MTTTEENWVTLDTSREAREQVGAAMAAMMDGAAGDVVPMRRGG